MADKNIGALPQADGLYDDSLFVVEHSGTAKNVSGRQFKDYAKEGVETYVESAQKAAQDAAASATQAGQAIEKTAASQKAAEAAQAAAEEAEQGAAEARTAIENMLVDAVTLATGQPATVSKELVDGVVKLVFGLPAGPKGDTGNPGSSIQSITRTSGTGAPGTTDSYTITLTDGSTTTFQVYNGADGIGAGDFMANGTVPMTGNLQMGGNRITGLAAPVDGGDAVRKADLAGLTVTTDPVPTQGSPNPVQSGGVFEALGGKQDKLTGTVGQVVGFQADGSAVAQDAPETGVISFNGRSGAVIPQAGDYTAGQVGARPSTWTPSATDVGALPITGGTLTGNLTLKGTQSYGTKINFGDGDYVHLYEISDDKLEIKAKEVFFTGPISLGRKTGTAVGLNSSAIGADIDASGSCSHAEGNKTVSSGDCSHAEGYNTKAIATVNYGAHAEGYSTTASGSAAHAEGRETTASGMESHAEGDSTTASGNWTHAEGRLTTASGQCSHAEGDTTIASGWASSASGSKTIANDYQFVIGSYNVEKSSTGLSDDRFIIGGGWGTRRNAFRVHSNGSVYGGQYYSSGADYAELFEWVDGNAAKEDRAGLFVALDGDQIRLAGPEDTDLLGIVSAVPSVVEDVYDDQWAGMYLRDVFGRTIMEEQDFPEETGPDGEVIREARRELAPKLNPDYDPTQVYLPRSQRPEWDAVGMMGKLVVVDDGTCKPNGYCKVAEGGIATQAEGRTPYRVLKRLDANHVQVLIR